MADRPRLERRIAVGVLAPLAAATLVAAPLLLWAVPRLLQEAVADSLSDALSVLATPLADSASLPQEVRQQAVVRLAAASRLRITLIAESGLVLADSDRTLTQVAAMDNHATRPEVLAARAGADGVSTRRSDTTSLHYVYAARQLLAGPHSGLIVRVARPLGQLEALHRHLGWVLAAAAAAAAAAALGVHRWSRRRILEPLEQLSAGARRIAEGDVESRLSEPLGDELGRLASAINRIAEAWQMERVRRSTTASDLERILDAMSDGVLLVREDGKVIAANRALFSAFGVEGTAEDAPLPLIIRRSEVWEVAHQAMRAGEASAEVRIDGHDGEQVLLLSARRLEYRPAALLVVRDDTAARRQEVARRDLVANLSHELKTPLSAIRGYGETLVEGAHDAATLSRFHRGILEQCRRLEAILADLLALARTEALGQERLCDRVRLDELVNEALETIAPRAAYHGVEIGLGPCPPATIVGDREILARLVGNLVSNAVQHNREGGRVEVRLLARDDEWVLEVEDDGPGIAEEALPRIFERFYRVDPARSRAAGGTGLGLAIVKHAAQRHGGRVEVESCLGVGSTFRVTLPA